MTPAEIQQSNEDAQAMAEHSARVHSAVDQFLAVAARCLLAIGWGTWLAVHLIQVIAEAL